MNGDQIYHALLRRGYSPPQAAALTGNILQESGGDPSRPNDKEGGHGLLQWRNERWRGLQDYAASRGSSPYDPDTQLDYIGVEMAGPEKRSATPFMAAPDVESANAALKRYIRYGDNSQGTRLSYARGFLNKVPTAPASTPRDGTRSLASTPGAAGTNPGDRAPASFNDRFGFWPSSPPATAPIQQTASPDGKSSSAGRNSGFGIYKYPTDNQLGFDPDALSASPHSVLDPDARYLVRVPSSQTSAPALPYRPRQASPAPGAAAPAKPDLALPPPVRGFPDHLKDDQGGRGNWLLQLLGRIGAR